MDDLLQPCRTLMPLSTPQEVLWPGRCLDVALARQPLNTAAGPLCTALESALAGRGTEPGPQALTQTSAASGQDQASCRP